VTYIFDFQFYCNFTGLILRWYDSVEVCQTEYQICVSQPMSCSDVCLEAEVSPRGCKSAALASPQRFDALAQSCLGLYVIASALP